MPRLRSARRKIALAFKTVSEDAYLAGLIDGEASICIAKERRRDCHDGCLTLNLHIATTNRRFATHLSKLYGFSMCATNAHLKNPNWTQAFLLQLRGGKAASVLRRAMPYLILKRGQAELAIEFVATTKRGGVTGRPRTSSRYSQREAERRTVMRNEMMRMNSGTGNAAPEN